MKKFIAQKIIFDLDGTLVDSAADLIAATNHCMDYIGRPHITLDEGRHMAGHGALPLIEHALLKSGGLNGINPKDHHQRFLNYYIETMSHHSTLFDGVIETLELLRGQGYQLAICTNKSIGLTTPLLQKFAIDHYFDVVHGGDSLAYSKPDPRHISLTLKAMQGNGLGVMVGDTKSDILPAQKLKIPAIAMAYGYSDIPLEMLNPDIILHSMRDLPAILSKK